MISPAAVSVSSPVLEPRAHPPSAAAESVTPASAPARHFLALEFLNPVSFSFREVLTWGAT